VRREEVGGGERRKQRIERIMKIITEQHLFDDCGVSVYRGVIVNWDSDYDHRVLQVLDDMPAKLLGSLLVIHEHEGSVHFIWDGDVPQAYQEGEGVEVGDYDYWRIDCSYNINQAKR